ncbi:hypothetical protein BH11VER1_BH11VER1_35580 [soil metagenome]
MFHRVLYENWHDLVPVIAFVLTFTVFLVAFIRALLMRKETVVAMSLLPLDDAPVASVAAPRSADAGTVVSGNHRKPCEGNCTDCCCSKPS